MASRSIRTDVSSNPRARCSATRRDVLIDHPVEVAPQLIEVDRRRAAERCGDLAAGRERRRRIGTSSPTGTPRRVTTNVSPSSS